MVAAILRRHGLFLFFVMKYYLQPETFFDEDRRLLIENDIEFDEKYLL